MMRRSVTISVLIASIAAILFVSLLLLNNSNTSQSIQDYSIVAVGDFGCNSNTDKVMTLINSLKPNLILGLGDYSYRTSIDCWLEELNNNKIDTSKVKLALGNHEYGSTQCLTYANYCLTDQERDKLMKILNMPNEGYYSFNYNNAHILVMNTEVPYAKDSKQYNFVVNDLSSASKNSKINWIIVAFHKPMYSSPSAHTALLDLRSIYQPIFDKYGVDLVLQGHTHAYERSKPMKYNEVVTDNSLHMYNKPNGEIFVTVGTGGASLYRYTEKLPYSATQASIYGVLEIRIRDNGSLLEARFISIDRNTLDIFSIEKNLNHNK